MRPMMTAKPQSKSISSGMLWRTWAGLALMVLVLHAWTLGLSPVVWQDEVQTIEGGRMLLLPDSPWNVTMGADFKSVPGISYAGSLLQEWFYRLAGNSYLGPRMANVLAACASSALLLAWLSRRGVMGGVALGVALLFLIDPCFDRSYRGGRADALVFLTAIAACWLLSSYPTGVTKVKKWPLLGAGLLTGILPWLWTTAVLLLPLILVELWRVVSPQAGKSMSKWVKAMLPFTVGILITSIGLAVPLWGVIESAFAATFHHVRWDVSASNPAAEGGAGLLPKVISVVRYSPFLPLLALLGGCVRGNRLLLVATVLVVGVVTGTRFYLYRYLYALPYLAVLAAAGLTWLGCLPLAGWRLSLMRWGPTLIALSWAVLLTFGVRNYVALQERPWRDHVSLVSALEKDIGRGPLKIYLGTFDLYFVGRELGWQMFRNKFSLPEAQMDQIYGRCDVVVRVPFEDTSEFQAQIKRLGFDQGTTLSVGPHAMPVEFQKPRYGGMAYGPYRVYRRLPGTGKAG